MINSKYYKRIDKKIKLANLKIKPKSFIYLRLIASIILFIILLLSSKYGYIYAYIAIIYYFLFEMLTLDREINKRTKIIEDNAIEFFSIFLLVYKSDKNLVNIIKKVIIVVDNELSRLFREALSNIEIGEDIKIALSNMNNKIPSILVNNIILNIIESNSLGTDISSNIELQLDNLKNKRRKEKLNSLEIIPYKLAIICGIFIILFIILLFTLKVI